MEEMSAMEQISYEEIQAKVFDFALVDLVLSKRAVFQPLWTVDSWAKFLIWLALNCGLSGEKESLEIFAEALGSDLTRRMRQIFFERTLESTSLRLIADPADENIIIFPISGTREVTTKEVLKSLENVGLNDRVDLEISCWQTNDSIISIPWKFRESDIEIRKSTK